MRATTRTVDHTGKAAAAIEATLSALVHKAAFDIQALAQEVTPEDTGYLKSSARTVPAGPLAASVKYSAEYALYVEKGTAYQAAQPFLEPAAEEVAAKMAAAGITIARANGLA